MGKMIGAAIMAVGILIGGASGICSLAAIASFVGPGSYGGSPSYFVNSFMMVLLFGGIPMMLGVGLYFMGRGIMQRAGDKEDIDDPRDDEPGA